MASDLKSMLGGGGGKPIGATAWFPTAGPSLIETEGRYYLRSGSLMTDEQANYPEAFSKFDVFLDYWAGPKVTPNMYSANCAVYANGILLIGHATGRISRSTDGLTFTTIDISALFGGNNINGLAYGAGLFVAVGTAGTIATSPDGITWTMRTSVLSTIWIGLVYASGKFVAVADGSRSMTSTDGITWTLSASVSFATAAPKSLAYGAGMFVAVASAGVVYSSPDGIAWTLRATHPTLGTLNSVVYGLGLFVAVGAGGIIYTSPDGLVWTVGASKTSFELLSVSFGDGYFVYSSTGTTVGVSKDGLNWVATPGSQIAPGGLMFLFSNKALLSLKGSSGGTTGAIYISTHSIGLPAGEYLGGSNMAIKYMRIK